MEQKISKQTILTWILLCICAILCWMLMFNNSKVKAAEDILEAKARISELKTLITDAQESYQIAQESIVECTESRTSVMNKAHDDAELYRNEIEELEGLIMNR